MKTLKTILFSIIILLLAIQCDDNNGTGKKREAPVFINRTNTEILGIDSLLVGPGQQKLLTASTFDPEDTPEYRWSTSDENIVEITATENNDRVYIKSVGEKGQRAEITVEDIANGGTKTIDVIVLFWPDMSLYIYIGEFEGHDYFHSINKYKWGSAKLLCEETGGHLLTLQSQEENDFANTLNADLRESAWIGMRWNDSLGYTTFATEWITGETLEFTNWWRPEEGTKYPQEIQNYLPYYFAMINRWGYWENQDDVPARFILELE
ncbi:MAG: C-type lectin domain-containing protein [Candidatus Marinimicrobia bacterium]|nr:C-type lectin domain-containing protein [Candidatus Neomarinimicrobiota bacterium]